MASFDAVKGHHNAPQTVAVGNHQDVLSGLEFGEDFTSKYGLVRATVKPEIQIVEGRLLKPRRIGDLARWDHRSERVVGGHRRNAADMNLVVAMLGRGFGFVQTLKTPVVTLI